MCAVEVAEKVVSEFQSAARFCVEAPASIKVRVSFYVEAPSNLGALPYFVAEQPASLETPPYFVSMFHQAFERCQFLWRSSGKPQHVSSFCVEVPSNL